MKKLNLLVLALMALLMIGCTPTVNGTTETSSWDFPIAEENLKKVSRETNNTEVIIRCRVNESESGYNFRGYIINNYNNEISLASYYLDDSKAGFKRGTKYTINSQEEIDLLNEIDIYFQSVSYTFAQPNDNKETVINYLFKLNKMYVKHNGSEPSLKLN